MKIPSVGADLFHAGGRTDDKDDEAVVAFRDFANLSGNCQVSKITDNECFISRFHKSLFSLSVYNHGCRSIYIYIYIYIYIQRERERRMIYIYIYIDLHPCVHIYIYICLCMYAYMYTHTHTHAQIGLNTKCWQ